MNDRKGFRELRGSLGRRVADELRSLALSLILGLMAFSLIPTTPAAAVPSCNGSSGFTIVDGGHFGGSIESPGQGLLVQDLNPSCAEIRSILLEDNSNNFVEIGWMADPTDVIVACQSFSNPHLLVFGEVGGHPECLQSPPGLQDGSFYDIAVQDTNHDGRFYFFLGTTGYGHYDMNFSTAEVIANTERHDETHGDGLHTNADGMRWLGNNGNWNGFDSGTVPDFYGVVNGWNLCYPVGNDLTHYKVRDTAC